MTESLQELPAVAQACVATAYGNFKRDLTEFIRGHSGSGQVVDLAAVKKFMAQCQEKQRDTLRDFFPNSD